MSGVLRAAAHSDQLTLLREVFTPFDRLGEWPVWAYVDHVMDAEGLVAADVLASLPVAGDQGGGRMRYGLTWSRDSHQPPERRDAAGADGRRHVAPGVGVKRAQVVFKDAVRFLVDRQRSITPALAGHRGRGHEHRAGTLAGRGRTGEPARPGSRRDPPEGLGSCWSTNRTCGTGSAVPPRTATSGS